MKTFFVVAVLAVACTLFFYDDAHAGYRCDGGTRCLEHLKDDGPRAYSGPLTCIDFRQRGTEREVYLRFFDRDGRVLFASGDPQGATTNLVRGTSLEGVGFETYSEGRIVWDPKKRKYPRICTGPWRWKMAYSFELCNDVQTYKGRRLPGRSLYQRLVSGDFPQPVLLWKH